MCDESMLSQFERYGDTIPVTRRTAGAGGAGQGIADGHRQAVMLTLRNKTRQVIDRYNAETKDYAFGDSGDAEMYADSMRDLLSEWLARVPL